MAGGSHPRRFGQVHAEPVAVALISPGHFGAGMLQLFLDIAFIDLGAAGQTRARSRASRSCAEPDQMMRIASLIPS